MTFGIGRINPNINLKRPVISGVLDFLWFSPFQAKTISCIKMLQTIKLPDLVMSKWFCNTRTDRDFNNFCACVASSTPFSWTGDHRWRSRQCDWLLIPAGTSQYGGWTKYHESICPADLSHCERRIPSQLPRIFQNFFFSMDPTNLLKPFDSSGPIKLEHFQTTLTLL